MPQQEVSFQRFSPLDISPSIHKQLIAADTEDLPGVVLVVIFSWTV